MKIAYTIGFAQIPPTYFAIQHAERMNSINAKLFGYLVEKHDTKIKTETVSVSPDWARNLPFRYKALAALTRERLLTKTIKSFEPQIIHQHFATWSKPAVTSAKDLGVPLAITLHGYDVFNQLAKPKNLLSRHHQKSFTASSDTADIILPVSKYLASQAVKAGVSPNKIEVLYLGVDTDFFTPAEKMPPADEIPTLLHVGGLFKRKGVEDILAASTSIQEKIPHKLVLIGDGPLKEAVLTAEQRYSHIGYRGSVNREGVRSAMREASLLVFATQKDGNREEAAGLVSLEAQACGTPVVVNDSGGAAEMIDDGVTGFTANRGDVGSLTKQITRFLTLSDADQVEMRKKAREFVVEERSLAASCSKLQKIYEGLL